MTCALYVREREYNGTRLVIVQMMPRALQATVLSKIQVKMSSHPQNSTDSYRYAIQFKRLQFPVHTCYSMSINKSQGTVYESSGTELITTMLLTWSVLCGLLASRPTKQPLHTCTSGQNQKCCISYSTTMTLIINCNPLLLS